MDRLTRDYIPPGRIDLAPEADFAIGPLMIRPSRRTVEGRGSSHLLQRRVMQVLVALAGSNNEVVSQGATSVVLDTVFVELTEAGARNIGIDLNNANGQIGTAAYTLAQGDFPGISNTNGAHVVNLQAAIYAQINKGQGRIISRPRIAAQNGSTAKIITGDALPILTSIAVSGVNAVQQQVQYVNVGVTLQIAPRVSDDGYVASHIFAVVASVTGYLQGSYHQSARGLHVGHGS